MRNEVCTNFGWHQSKEGNWAKNCKAGDHGEGGKFINNREARCNGGCKGHDGDIDHLNFGELFGGNKENKWGPEGVGWSQGSIRHSGSLRGSLDCKSSKRVKLYVVRVQTVKLCIDISCSDARFHLKSEVGLDTKLTWVRRPVVDSGMRVQVKGDLCSELCGASCEVVGELTANHLEWGRM